jgi:hypothetical protein
MGIRSSFFLNQKLWSDEAQTWWVRWGRLGEELVRILRLRYDLYL